MDTKEYIECNCGTIEHVLRFSWIPGDDLPFLYVETHLSSFFPWYKRLWYAIKYIIGYRSKYGCFDETLLSCSEVKQLRNLCDRFLKETST